MREEIWFQNLLQPESAQKAGRSEHHKICMSSVSQLFNKTLFNKIYYSATSSWRLTSQSKIRESAWEMGSRDLALLFYNSTLEQQILIYTKDDDESKYVCWICGDDCDKIQFLFFLSHIQVIHHVRTYHQNVIIFWGIFIEFFEYRA